MSNAIYFNFMLYNCKEFNQDLSRWNISKGEYFSSMFFGCKSFNANLSNWDVSAAKNWDNFAKGSLLEKYPERIPERFRDDYL